VKARRLSVLHFSNETVRGGIEEHILGLLRGLDRERFRLHLACPPELSARLGGDLPPDVEVVPVRLSRPTQAPGWIALAKCLRRHRIDILHSHGAYGSLFASPTGWLCGVPVIVETSHAREVWRKGILTSHFVWDRIVGAFVHQYIAVSQSNVRYLVGEKKLPAEKIAVIRPAIDLNRYSPDFPACPSGRTKLGFAENDPVLLVVGRLEPQKGHRFLLAAMPRVLQSFPSAKLVCVSGGSLRAGLENMARELGVSDSVRFVGYQPDLREWLALADIVVLPSLYEGLPVSPIEALACERAVVATAVDGTPEVVLDGKTGLTVPPEDVPALASAICRLLGDAGLRRSLAVAGREWVRAQFGQELLVKNTADLYLSLWRRNVA
jgi:glycosyltransferase involved in cell wall biosynthesis